MTYDIIAATNCEGHSVTDKIRRSIQRYIRCRIVTVSVPVAKTVRCNVAPGNQSAHIASVPSPVRDVGNRTSRRTNESWEIAAGG